MKKQILIVVPILLIFAASIIYSVIYFDKKKVFTAMVTSSSMEPALYGPSIKWICPDCKKKIRTSFDLTAPLSLVLPEQKKTPKKTVPAQKKDPKVAEKKSSAAVNSSAKKIADSKPTVNKPAENKTAASKPLENKGTVQSKKKPLQRRPLPLEVEKFFQERRSFTCPFCGTEIPIEEAEYISGDVLTLQKTSLPFQRYDIAVIENGDGTGIVKRIVGLPGETVSIDHGDLIVNGSPLKRTTKALDITTVELSDFHMIKKPDRIIVVHQKLGAFDQSVSSSGLAGKDSLSVKTGLAGKDSLSAKTGSAGKDSLSVKTGSAGKDSLSAKTGSADKDSLSVKTGLEGKSAERRLSDPSGTAAKDDANPYFGEAVTNLSSCPRLGPVDYSQIEYVRDFTISFEMRPASIRRENTFFLNRGTVFYMVQLDLEALICKLYSLSNSPKAFDSLLPEDFSVQPVSEQNFRSIGQFGLSSRIIHIYFIDRFLEIMIDNEVVMRWQEPENDAVPVPIEIPLVWFGKDLHPSGALGLRVRRDLHYSAPKEGEASFRKEYKIPENEYFLLGDNSPVSKDSRNWEPATIPKEKLYRIISTLRIAK